MGRFKADEQGNVIDAEGNPLVIGDEPVKLTDIEGAVSQQTMDTKIQERLARQNDRIKALEAQANRTPELEKLLSDLKTEKSQLEEQVANVQASAKAESEAQVQRVQTERDKYRTDLEAERAARVRDQVSTLILGKAGSTFNDPAIDVVPHLLAAHKREEKKGPDGKGTGDFVDFFKVCVKKDDGADEEKFVPVEQALSHWAEAHPHHVRASGNAGSGGGSYVNTQNVKRSSMSSSQKSEFIAKHGREAFQALPE